MFCNRLSDMVISYQEQRNFHNINTHWHHWWILNEFSINSCNASLKRTVLMVAHPSLDEKQTRTFLTYMGCRKPLQRRHMGAIYLKSQAIRLIVYEVVQAYFNGKSKLNITCLCEGNPWVSHGFPSLKIGKAENVVIPWRHYIGLIAWCQATLCERWFSPFYRSSCHYCLV